MAMFSRCKFLVHPYLKVILNKCERNEDGVEILLRTRDVFLQARDDIHFFTFGFQISKHLVIDSTW